MTETKEVKYGEKSRKAILIPTYLAAVACLIAGLLVPLFRSDAEFFSDRMMIKYIPQMINTLLSFTGKKVIPDSNFFIPSVEFEGKFSLSVIATFSSATVILYTVMCAVSLVMIIPVCLTDGKKRTGFRCAASVEIITLILVVVHIAFDFYWMVSFGISQGINARLTDINMIFPLFGALLAVSIQSISKNGYIGVSKTAGVILSILTALCFFSFSLFIPAADGALSKLSSLLGAGKKAGFVTGIAAFNTGYGVDALSVLYGLSGTSASDGGQSLQIVIYIFSVILFFIVTADVILDIIDVGIGRKIKTDKDRAYVCKNSFSNNITLFRYGFTLGVALLLFIFCFAAKGVMPGVYLYFLLIFLILQLVNTIIRTAMDGKRFKKAKELGVIDEGGLILDSIVDNSEEADDVDSPSDEPLVLLEPGFEEGYNDENKIEEPEPEEEHETEVEPESVPETEVEPEPELEVEDEPIDEPEPEDRLEAEPSEAVQEHEHEPEPIPEPAEETEVEPEPEDRLEAEPSEDVQEHEPEPEPIPEVEPESEEEPETEQSEPIQEHAHEFEPEPIPEPIQKPEPISGIRPERKSEQSGVECDTFINSLNENERNEFTDVFINKKSGGVAGVPDYKPGRDNSAFFEAVFKHISKCRKICSDRLLVKIYKQLNR